MNNPSQPVLWLFLRWRIAIGVLLPGNGKDSLLFLLVLMRL